MTPPVRELDDNGPLNYAPKKPKRPEQDRNPDQSAPDQSAPRADSAPSPNTPESSDPPWKQKEQHGTFAGDLATGELRTRLTLVPDRVQEPRSPGSAVPLFGIMPSVVGVIVVVAAAIIGYRWGSASLVAPPSHELAPASGRTDVKPTAAPSTAGGGANTPGAVAAQTARARVTSTVAAPQGDAPEIAFLLKNGRELMANADVAAARLMFQRAAEAGSAEAAFALAETYDPLVFKRSGRRQAVTLDIALAQSWYEKARTLGSAAAPERIVRLTQLPE
jgi:hypothetical protein